MTNQRKYYLLASTLVLSSLLGGCLAPPPMPATSAQQVAASNSARSLAMKLAKQGVEIIVLGDTVRIILYTDHCLEVNTPTILESCQPVLNNIVAYLQAYNNPAITISAYTDDLLSASEAQFITQNQATSIMTYLWVHGIPYETMQAKGYGSEDNIASNFTSRGSGFNRRVEIRFRTFS